MSREYVPAWFRTPAVQAMQASVTSAIRTWMVSHELLPADRATSLAAIIGTFCCRCSPWGEQHEISRAEDHHVVARLLAVLLCLDDPAPGRQDAGEVPGALERGASAICAGTGPADSPWLRALSELLRDLAGPAGRDIETFKAAFLDHCGGVQEETRAVARTAGAPAWSARRDWLADYLRLRPLLIGTEPYLRCWQTLLGRWPAPALVAALEAEAPAVRRAHPQVALDHALDVARQAHASGCTRRAPALSEIEALVVVSTYLANDLGSRERDRRAQGQGGDPNLALLLERYFLGDGAEIPEHSREEAALQRAEAAIVDMYNIGISRFHALRTYALAMSDSPDTRQYLTLLGRVVDGNLISTIEHAGSHAGSQAGAQAGAQTGAQADAQTSGQDGSGIDQTAASTRGAAASAGHEAGARYGSLDALRRLDWIDEQL